MKKLDKHQRGMIDLTLVVALLAVLVVGGFVAYRITSDSVRSNKKDERQTATNQTSKDSNTDTSKPEDTDTTEPDDEETPPAKVLTIAELAVAIELDDATQDLAYKMNTDGKSAWLTSTKLVADFEKRGIATESCSKLAMVIVYNSASEADAAMIPGYMNQDIIDDATGKPLIEVVKRVAGTDNKYYYVGGSQSACVNSSDPNDVKLEQNARSAILELLKDSSKVKSI